MIKLTSELCDLIWDGLSNRISNILEDEPTMTPADHKRIMNSIKAIHYGKTN